MSVELIIFSKAFLPQCLKLPLSLDVIKHVISTFIWKAISGPNYKLHQGYSKYLWHIYFCCKMNIVQFASRGLYDSQRLHSC